MLDMSRGRLLNISLMTINNKNTKVVSDVTEWRRHLCSESAIFREPDLLKHHTSQFVTPGFL